MRVKEMFRIDRILLMVGILSFISTTQVAVAKRSRDLHPRNKQLMELNLMTYPKYFPNIPRVTATEALALYKKNKALFILISYRSKHLIHGGIHLTEGRVPRINPNSLPLRKDQVLILYCP